ncbi:Solute carrier family 23 member 2, partial [Lamellibrachia satsuma]
MKKQATKKLRNNGKTLRMHTKKQLKKYWGTKKKGQKPWISKESWELVEERKRLKNNIEQTKSDRIKQNYMDKYRCKDKEVKKSMRLDKRKWVDHLAMEAEEAANNGKMKEVYAITKTLSNDKRKTTNAVKDKGGNLITEGLARRERWKEHFEEILNRPIPDDPVTDVEIDPIINEISTDPITKAEIRTALRKMKNGKAGGKDEITAELLKADMNTTEKWLVKLFRTFWEQEKVPKTWKQGLIVKIPKKGPVEEALNIDGNSITVEDPGDTATNISSGNNVLDPSVETPSGGLDKMWTDRHALIFDVDDCPPFYITFVYALQQALESITGCMVTVLIITESICAGDNNLLVAQFLSTSVFLVGVATLLQTTLGMRLPFVQGSSFAFIPPVVAMMSTKQWQCPQHLPYHNVTQTHYGGNITYGDVEPWNARVAELSGGLILASLVQVFIGCTGIIGTLMRFIGPLTIIPTISLIGLSMVSAAANACQRSWIVSMCGVALMCLFSLRLHKVRLPLPTWNRAEGCHSKTYPVFQLFALALAIVVCWIIAHIFTVTNFFPDDSSHPNYKARTDSKLSTITLASWIYLPYPGQFGWPTFGAGAFAGMLAATIATTIESVGVGYATARICALPPPPKHTINRGIAIEGLASVLSGFFGVCHGTTTYSTAIGFIGVTG